MHYTWWHATLLSAAILSASAQYNPYSSQQSSGQQSAGSQQQQQQQQHYLRNGQYINNQLYLQQTSGQQQSRQNSLRSAQFINTPVYVSNTTTGARVTVRLISYNNPNLSLPDGKTCVCPTGKTCPYLKTDRPSCQFSFTIIISAPDQSVQYISTEFVYVTSGTLNSGNWTAAQVVNMSSKPTSIDVFVHHFGVVIDQEAATLEQYDHLVHVDTFVVSLVDYSASQEGSALNTARGTYTGQLQGTTLQLEYGVQCIGNKVGKDCDLICGPSATDNTYAACNSSVTGMQASCRYYGGQVTDCNICLYGLNANQTACQTSNMVQIERVGVSSAYRVWTIVLGCLLGIAVIFIISLVAFYIIVKNKESANAPATAHYSNNLNHPYVAASTRPLIQKDEEWDREAGTRITATNNVQRAAGTDFETSRTSEESFARSSAAATSRREAQV